MREPAESTRIYSGDREEELVAVFSPVQSNGALI